MKLSQQAQNTANEIVATLFEKNPHLDFDTICRQAEVLARRKRVEDVVCPRGLTCSVARDNHGCFVNPTCLKTYKTFHKMY